MLLFALALLLVAACIIGKALAVALIQKYEDAVRRCQQKLSDANGRAKVAQQKYIIAQKAEGVAAHKVSTLKHRLSALEEQIAHVELQEIQQELEKQHEVGIVLDQVVRKALGQVGDVDDERVRQVMSVITSLIDLEKQGSADDLVAAIREKLTQIKEAQKAAQQDETSPAAQQDETSPAAQQEGVPPASKPSDVPPHAPTSPQPSVVLLL